MRTSADVKAYFLQHGADLCGIASTDRFGDAPEGYRPQDILPTARSVIVFARRFPVATLQCPSSVPYTVARNTLSTELDWLACRFCTDAEAEGVAAVPTGAIGPTERDPRDGRMRNILSAKHAAQAAGLGVIGRNTLLITSEFGNMVWLNAVVCDLALQADPLMTANWCEGCKLCESACPVGAVGKPAMAQDACASFAFGGENGGEWKIRCFRCREVCPHCYGDLNRPTAGVQKTHDNVAAWG